MVRLPSKYDLSGPANMRSGRPIASIDTSGLARGVGQLGASLENLGSEIHRDDTATSVIGADGPATKERHDLFQSISQDGDYNTSEDRYTKGAAAIKAKYAANITDPKARRMWEADYDKSTESDRVRLTGMASSKLREDRLVVAKGSLNSYKQIIADDTVSEADRQKAKASADASISALQQQGDLDPSEADQWRTSVLKGGDFVLGQRVLQRNPGAISRNRVTASDIPPEGAALLNAISSTESPGYDVINGGQRFSGYADHPRVGVTIKKGPNAGKTSTAAGRYQFLGSTWDRAALAVGAKDFSPANQDRAAWWLAQNDYKASTGRDLLSDLQSKDPTVLASVRKALEPTWEGLKVESDKAFVNKVSNGSAELPSWYTDQTPEDQLRLDQYAEARDREMRIERRSGIEDVIQSAPSAVQYNGSYSGPLPTRQDFIDAYGADGGSRFSAFQASMDVAQQSYGFRTMSDVEIQKAVEAARPSSTGTDAALQAKRFEALSQAATQTITARKADPSLYVQQVYPQVRQKWDDAIKSGDMSTAYNAMASAQRDIGIKDMKLLPDTLADRSVTAFKNAADPAETRLNAVAGLIFATNDQSQRRAVYQQLVAAGLPPTMNGVFEAMARGDKGAASRLMEAVVADPAKLPNAGDVKPAVINEQIYDEIWAPGQIGYTAYGLGFGDASSVEKAQIGTDLVTRSVKLRMAKGESLSNAVDGAKRDLFGDKVMFQREYGPLHADIALDKDVDQAALYQGLIASKKMFADQLTKLREGVVGDVETDDPGFRAIVKATSEHRVGDIVDNGIFVEVGDHGIGLRDAYTGQFVAGDDGKPLTVDIPTAVARGNDMLRASAAGDVTIDQLGGWVGQARRMREMREQQASEAQQ